MTGGFQLGYGHSNAADYGDITATTAGTALTAGSSNNTKGSYAELVASTSYDAIGFWVELGLAGISTRSIAVDIAIGGSGSEVVIVPNLIFQTTGTVSNYDSRVYFVPLPIPAGTRISARAQSNFGSLSTIQCAVILMDGTIDARSQLSSVTAYGFSSGSTLGTVIDPGGTANTKSGWVQLTSSSTNDVRSAFLGIDRDLQTTGGAHWLLDIGVGGAGSEVVVVPNLFFTFNTQMITGFPNMDLNIPAGSRIAARAQCSVNTSTARNLDVVLYGVD